MRVLFVVMLFALPLLTACSAYTEDNSTKGNFSVPDKRAY